MLRLASSLRRLSRCHALTNPAGRIPSLALSSGKDPCIRPRPMPWLSIGFRSGILGACAPSVTQPWGTMGAFRWMSSVAPPAPPESPKNPFSRVLERLVSILPATHEGHPSFNRWLMLIPGFAIHLCLGSLYVSIKKTTKQQSFSSFFSSFFSSIF